MELGWDLELYADDIGSVRPSFGRPLTMATNADAISSQCCVAISI